MLTKFLALIQTWEDSEKQVPLFAPPDRLLSLEIDGFGRAAYGKFRLENASPSQIPLALGFNGIVNVAGVFIRSEGLAGFDMTVTKTSGAGGGSYTRKIRPPSVGEDAEGSMPAAFYLETCGADVASISIVFPGVPSADLNETVTEGIYVIVGDPAP